MKILHFSDLHLDTPFASSYMPVKLAQGCRLRLRRTLLKLLDLAVEYEVDAVTIAGDLFEGNQVSRDTIRFLMDSFAQIAPIPVLIAPGNHDYYSPVSPYARLDWPGNVFIFSSNQLQPFHLTGEIVVWGMAHTQPNQTDNPLQGFHASQEGKRHIVLMHASETEFRSEAHAQYAPFQTRDIVAAGLDFALLGHYHGARLLTLEKTVGAYPGSPQPLNFGEQGDHGAILLNLQNNQFQCQLIPTATQAFVHLNFNPENFSDTHSLAEAIIEAVPAKAAEANFLRVNLTGIQPIALNLQFDLLREHLGQC
ncbi:MAG: hypothetical protein D6814_08170, partial [Calditrichaeota bacterium]